MVEDEEDEHEEEEDVPGPGDVHQEAEGGVEGEHGAEEQGLVQVVELDEGGQGQDAHYPDVGQVLQTHRPTGSYTLYFSNFVFSFKYTLIYSYVAVWDDMILTALNGLFA